jgi:hypothetical protein
MVLFIEKHVQDAGNYGLILFIYFKGKNKRNSTRPFGSNTGVSWWL